MSIFKLMVFLGGGGGGGGGMGGTWGFEIFVHWGWHLYGGHRQCN
jgi:hypothetical protein